MPTNRKPRLPLLPFGEKIAVSENDPKAYADRLARANSSLCGYEPAGNPRDFASKSAILQVNGMKMVSGANTPLIVEFGEVKDITLLLPFSGAVTLEVDGDKHSYGVNQGAMLLPPIGRSGRSTLGSSVLLTLSPERMNETARAMLGVDASQTIDLKFQQPRVLPWRWQNVAFDETFRHLCGVIDNLSAQSKVLAQLGIDDMLCRQAVLMLRPDLFLANVADLRDQAVSSMSSRRAIDVAVTYIKSHLAERITLSDLERVSCMSARALQYAFQERLQCTPMAWLKQQRLAQARRMLLVATPSDTVTQIALACGFTNPGLFAADYKKQYGELPSSTVRGP